MQVDIGVVIALVGAAISAGAALSKLGALAERVKALETFRDRIAARVERLEVKVGYRRAPTVPGNLGVPLSVEREESSE